MKIFSAFFLTLAVFLLLVLLTSAALATPQCTQRDRMIAALSEQFDEHLIGGGVRIAGGLLEIFSTHDGSTWSIVMTAPNGISCLAEAGRGWRKVAPKPHET